jgi:hypothetical protein
LGAKRRNMEGLTMPKITITVEISDREAELIGSTSIERVHNNAIWCAERARFKNPLDEEQADVLREDSEAVKEVSSRLWDAARNGWFLHVNGK